MGFYGVTHDGWVQLFVYVVFMTWYVYSPREERKTFEMCFESFSMKCTWIIPIQLPGVNNWCWSFVCRDRSDCVHVVVADTCSCQKMSVCWSLLDSYSYVKEDVRSRAIDNVITIWKMTLDTLSHVCLCVMVNLHADKVLLQRMKGVWSRLWVVLIPSGGWLCWNCFQCVLGGY